LIKLSNEAKIGLTVLAAVVVMFIGFRVMRDIPVFRQSYDIYAVYEQASGLNTGGQVQINGVRVGSVTGVSLTKQDSVKITMSIERDKFISKGSVAYLRSIDMLGQKAIVIERGGNENRIPAGGRIKGVYEESFVNSIKGQGQKIGANVSNSVDRLNVFLEKMNKLMSSQNRDNVGRVLENAGTTSDEILDLVESKNQELGQAITSARRTLQNLDTLSTENRSHIDSTLARLERTTKEMDHLTRELRNTNKNLNQLLSGMNEGKGSMGQLVNNPSLYNNLDSLAAELKVFTREFNENPKRFLKHMKMVEIF